jgi:hypothetical protein
LSVTFDSEKAGTRAASLRYLTPGLGWSADYVALFDAKAGRVDVQGWVTLTNSTGTTYANAATLLVAGAVNIANPGYRSHARGNIRTAGTASGYGRSRCRQTARRP